MKRNGGRFIARAKAKIERRLAGAVRVNEGGPVMGGKPVYELSDRVVANPWGGIGLIHRMVKKLGLPEVLNSEVNLLKVHVPYHESDHILNIAYNLMCGGQTLDDIEHRRKCQGFLDTIGAKSIPDPTTAGDFCRRFDDNSAWLLMESINKIRVDVWKQCGPTLLNRTARIDADGTHVPTTGECKEGMDIGYNGKWGYHPLVVSLANTGEPLFITNRSGNRPSHEGAVPVFNRAIELCRDAGFKDVLLRGDTDFALTSAFDAWSADGVRFVFGIDARKNLVQIAGDQPEDSYRELQRRAEAVGFTKRQRPPNVLKKIVRERGFENLITKDEDLCEFSYRPGKCAQDYRVVALRKNISHERGENVLFEEYRYFFYITNDVNLTPDQVVQEARQRCNQENLHAQMKSGVHALHAPVNTLCANWAYMIMGALAWTLKAWLTLLMPCSPRWKQKHEQERDKLLRMEFRGFVTYFVAIPCQVILSGRRIILRALAWNQWQATFFRMADAM